MIPNGKEMTWKGHHLVFESENDQSRFFFFRKTMKIMNLNWMVEDTFVLVTRMLVALRVIGHNHSVLCLEKVGLGEN